MEEPENNAEPKAEHGHPAKGPAKVIRAGGEAKAGQSLPRDHSGSGGDRRPDSAPAATAAVPILCAGRQAVEGAEAARQQAFEGAEAAGQQVLKGAEAAVGELLYCRTPYGLLQWQSNLLRESADDLSATNARILRLVSH